MASNYDEGRASEPQSCATSPSCGSKAKGCAGQTASSDNPEAKANSVDAHPDAVSGATVVEPADAPYAQPEADGDKDGGANVSDRDALENDAARNAEEGNRPEESESASSSKPDAITGATPGVAAACRDYGFTSPDTVDLLLGVKPPGER